jgi:protein-disulfide isomerase
LATGLALAAGFVVLQIGFSRGGSVLTRLPAGENADTGPGPDRQVAVLGGDLTLTVRELPILGSPDAGHLLVLLYDYACPHCRATHGYLKEGLDRYPGQYGIVLLPVPLDGKCNPTVEETEPRFKDSCELARLALALWRASPAGFPQFDAWLYESESPRSADEARARAESLAGKARLDAALEGEWVGQRIAANIKAYKSSRAAQIPVLVSPAIDTVVGRPENSGELFSLLERELGLRTAAPAESSSNYDRQ